MHSFSEQKSTGEARARKIALLSLLPGLGQLFNKRLDKAVAFFLVNSINIVVFCIFANIRLPFTGYGYASWTPYMYEWRVGSAPFNVLLFLLACYTSFAIFDAYTDALKGERGSWLDGVYKPIVTLSLATCVSYIAHLTTVMLACFFVLAKVFPIDPIAHCDHAIELELMSGEQSSRTGQEETGEALERARIPEKIAEAIRLSRISALQSNIARNPLLDTSNKETSAAASKQIINPGAQQSPRDTRSSGASDRAKEITITQSRESQNPSSSRSEQILKEEQKAEARKIAYVESAKSELETKQSQQADRNPAFAKGGFAEEIDQAQSKQTIARLTPPEQKFLMLEPPLNARADLIAATQYKLVQNAIYGQGSEAEPVALMVPEEKQPSPQGQAPSMLGFMDETLSSSPAMQMFWADYSKLIGRVVRENQSKLARGSAMATFSFDRKGSSVNIEKSSNSALAQKLQELIESMPQKSPVPQEYQDRVFAAIKINTEGAKPFVSVELQSQPLTPSAKSLQEFKGEVKLQAYLQDLKKQIYSSWNPPIKDGSKPVMVGFRIMNNGKVTDHKIVQSSGDPKMDQAALDAAKSVTDWTAPPAGTDEELDISMIIQSCTGCNNDKESKQAKAVLTY